MIPDFIITVDTEGDNLWARPRAVTTRNAVFLPRFQALAEKYGFKPTWLINWEMARAPACVEVVRDALARGAGEAGLHLHAWDSPPLTPLTADDIEHHPFLGEYPETVMRAKIDRLAGVLEDTFQQPLRAHRAGRWAFDGRYARLLRARGLTVDCSVCPGVDWRHTRGAPQGAGGPDYRAAPADPYFPDERDITRPAAAPPPGALLEVPMTTGRNLNWGQRAARRLFSSRATWLRPDGRNGAQMRAGMDEAVNAGRAHVMFMLHSSELMPGGSPAFRTAAAIERLYADTEALFAHASARGCAGRTLGDFAAAWKPRVAPLTNN